MHTDELTTLGRLLLCFSSGSFFKIKSATNTFLLKIKDNYNQQKCFFHFTLMTEGRKNYEIMFKIATVEDNIVYSTQSGIQRRIFLPSIAEEIVRWWK